MPSLPLSRRRALAGAALVIGALVVAGTFLVHAGAPAAPLPIETLEPARPAPPAKLLVHVVGAVHRPGLYRLDEGSRTADAVHRAGGATRRADLAQINLAAPVADGAQVVVPTRSPIGAGQMSTNAGLPQGPVHLNTATLDELDELPGVGPVTAQKIVEYRQTQGAFASVDDLDAIPGIGPARLEELRKRVVP
jgi:competence protein ComEA